MHRALKTLVVLVLVTLVPLRAAAGVTIGFCASGHQDMAVAEHAHHGEGVPAQPVKSSCNICAEHCSSAAFAIPAAPAVDARVSGPDRTVLAEHAIPLHVPGQPDRPPLA